MAKGRQRGGERVAKERERERERELLMLFHHQQKMLSIQPSIAEKANIVAMAGSVYKCYGGAPGPCPEYNIFENVPASQVHFPSPPLLSSPLLSSPLPSLLLIFFKAVYNATWNTTITPLDTCGLAIVNGSTYQTFLAANNSDHPLVQTLLMVYSLFLSPLISSYLSL